MISEETKQFFRAVMGDDVVKDIAVSVDKVTVGHVSFSVVCTYFFLYGKQHVFLNELAIMEEDDYNSEGAAMNEYRLGKQVSILLLLLPSVQFKIPILSNFDF